MFLSFHANICTQISNPDITHRNTLLLCHETLRIMMFNLSIFLSGEPGTLIFFFASRKDSPLEEIFKSLFW